MAAEIDQQKAQLLDTLAQQGTMGAQAVQAQQAAFQASKANAAQATYDRMYNTSAAPPPDALLPQLTQGSALIGDTYAQDASRSAATMANEYNRLRTANGMYMDQVNAAIPVLQTRARALAQQAAEKRAFEREQAQMALQNQREQQALEREKLAYEREILEEKKAQRINGGSVLSYQDAANTLGYNPDLAHYIAGQGPGTEPGIEVNELDPATGQKKRLNPYQEIFSAGAEAHAKGGTWQEVQNAMRIKENEMAVLGGHGWNNELNLALAQFKPAYNQAQDHAPPGSVGGPYTPPAAPAPPAPEKPFVPQAADLIRQVVAQQQAQQQAKEPEDSRIDRNVAQKAYEGQDQPLVVDANDPRVAQYTVVGTTLVDENGAPKGQVLPNGRILLYS